MTRRVARSEWLALLVILTIYGGLSLYAIRTGAPFGHDESVYALRARYFAGDTSVPLASYWVAYRAPGLPWLLQWMWPIGSTEPFLRLAVAAIGAAGVALTWAIGRHLLGPKPALIGAAGLAVTPLWLSSSTQVWPDVPGAVLGLLALGILLWSSKGDRFAWWSVLAVPVALLALIVRFGAPLPLVIGGAAILAVRGRAVRNSWPLLAGMGVLSGAGAYAVLYTSWLTDGGDLPGVAVADLSAAAGGPSFANWIDWAAEAPGVVATVVGAALVVGVALALVVPARDQRRDVTLIMAIGVLTAVAIITTLHAELRYLSPAVPWLWLGAGWGLSRIDVPLRGPALAAVLAVALVPVVGSAAQATSDELDLLKDRFVQLKAASSADLPPGAVVATSYTPQVGWYANRPTMRFPGDDVAVNVPEQATHVVYALGGKRQPEGLEDWLAANATLVESFGDRSLGNLRYAELWRIDR